MTAQPRNRPAPENPIHHTCRCSTTAWSPCSSSSRSCASSWQSSLRSSSASTKRRRWQCSSVILDGNILLIDIELCKGSKLRRVVSLHWGRPSLYSDPPAPPAPPTIEPRHLLPALNTLPAHPAPATLIYRKQTACRRFACRRRRHAPPICPHPIYPPHHTPRLAHLLFTPSHLHSYVPTPLLTPSSGGAGRRRRHAWRFARRGGGGGTAQPAGAPPRVLRPGRLI